MKNKALRSVQSSKVVLKKRTVTLRFLLPSFGQRYGFLLLADKLLEGKQQTVRILVRC